MILGIDTSAVVCTAALAEEGKTQELFSVGNERTHSETLLPGVAMLLERRGLRPSDLDAIAVSAGPGSFTGLRIGIAAVKGLAAADAVPCVPVSTLEALAYRFRGEAGRAVLCPVMDARRGEFYNALFSLRDGAIERLTEDRAIAGESLAKELAEKENVIILGDGAGKFASLYPAAGTLAPEEKRYQSGDAVAVLGEIIWKNGGAVPCEKLSPRYLRLPQAEREWLAKQNPVQKEGNES